MFKLFDKRKNASDKAINAIEKQLDADQLLSNATKLLSRLRAIQPSDPEAFPLLNEASRCGKLLLSFQGRFLLIRTHC
jgi:hypothetical protein